MNKLTARPVAVGAPKPATLKDEDIYVVDLASQSVVSTLGASSPIREMVRYQGLPLKVGQALMHGSHLRWWSRKLYECEKQVSQRSPMEFHVKETKTFLPYTPPVEGFFVRSR